MPMVAVTMDMCVCGAGLTSMHALTTTHDHRLSHQAERLAGQAAIAEEAARKQAEAEARRLRAMEDALEGEDALSSYDPYGRGVYKGIDLSKAGGVVEATAEVDLGGDAGGPVAFKKRKVGAVKNNRRKKEEDGED